MKNTQATKQRKPIEKATGRPWFDGKKVDYVIAKLEQVFAMDGTIEEACSYAEISRDSYYRYIAQDTKFRDRIEDLRQRPILKARQTIIKSLDDPVHSKWYLERKMKKEFAERTELTGKDGADLPTPIYGGKAL